MTTATRFGLTGLGNYAGEICQRLLREQESKAPAARLVAVCDPRAERHGTILAELHRHGVAVVKEYDELLALDIECLWLPLPIDLHRPYSERALAAGKHVICEKPAAGSLQDVDAMIAARDRSGRLCVIGYQDAYQPAVWELKRRLLSGEFGVVLSGSIIGCWPRSQSYYSRNDWAGKVQREGRWVLDSPASNAFAHYIHLAQFLMGPSEDVAAIPAEVEAELYRVNPIESYDTCALRMTFEGGTHLLVHLTHACSTAIDPVIILRTQFAMIRYLPKQLRVEILTSGVTESIPLESDRQGPILAAVHRALREGDASEMATLEMGRAHTLAICAAAAATRVVDVAGEHVETLDDHGTPLRTIRGIEKAMQQATERGRMLHECGIASWSKPAGDVYTDAAWRFEGTAERR